jgi:hypothetical protein
MRDSDVVRREAMPPQAKRALADVNAPRDGAH